MKNKAKSLTVVLALAAILAITVIAGFTATKSISAKAAVMQEHLADVSSYDAVSGTQRLFTNISVSLTGGSSYVTAVAKTEFTLFTSTISVIVSLYSSSTYQESCSAMTYESSNSTSNLAIFDTIETSAYTGGTQKYWRGRVEYKVDDGNWTTLETSTILCNGDGTLA